MNKIIKNYRTPVPSTEGRVIGKKFVCLYVFVSGSTVIFLEIKNFENTCVLHTVIADTCQPMRMQAVRGGLSKGRRRPTVSWHLKII